MLVCCGKSLLFFGWYCFWIIIIEEYDGVCIGFEVCWIVVLIRFNDGKDVMKWLWVGVNIIGM